MVTEMFLLENIHPHMLRKILISIPFLCACLSFQNQPESWIRINLAGYKPQGTKVAVWGSKEDVSIQGFEVVDKKSGDVVYKGKAGDAYGAYGPFRQTYRLNFTAFTKPGSYFLRAGTATS